ncbi:ABC transporter ATP-binding protein [Candidatus Bipolaricaulota bacterium]|nr:ABC transporter ATP-binding protein [Candidatus Bipolaricaulota bacterium]
MAEIRLERVRKTFGRVVAVKDVDLTIADGEFLVLLGPSGCGKTTTLRCIAGLERADTGRIFIGGRNVTELPPARRGIAMVFQSYAVFPHMTVAQNIGFGLRMRHIAKREIRAAVQEAAELLQIDELLDRYPAQLSGGQRQRVAVARAIVMKPEVLLMDEPLSNLDALLRLQMRAELKRLHREIGTTTVYVTHDQVEALSLGDRIAVMREGAVVQLDHPNTVYDRPATTFVAGFIGTPPMNFLRATVNASGDDLALAVGDFTVPLPPAWKPSLRTMVGKLVVVGIRAENIGVHADATPGSLPATVLVSEPLGAQQLLTVQVGKDVLKVTTAPEPLLQAGQTVGLTLIKEKLRLFDEESGKALSIGAGPPAQGERR